MWDAVRLAFTNFIGLVGQLVTAITDSENGALVGLLPLFAIGIAISVFMVGFKAIRKITWGA